MGNCESVIQHLEKTSVFSASSVVTDRLGGADTAYYGYSAIPDERRDGWCANSSTDPQHYIQVNVLVCHNYD